MRWDSLERWSDECAWVLESLRFVFLCLIQEGYGRREWDIGVNVLSRMYLTPSTYRLWVLLSGLGLVSR